MKGLVLKATGSFYRVKDEEGIQYECRLKGNLRLRDFKFTNPVVVGDVVTFSSDGKGGHLISEIEKRRNYIIRKSVKLSSQVHIIASNIDHAVLLVTMVQPKTYPEFIDRFLVTAGAYHIPAVLIFNKTDLLDSIGKAELERTIKLYEKLSYRCIETSALTQTSFDEIRQVLGKGTKLFSGLSGVGKSTLLNKLDPSLNLKTADISESFESGKHTTTYAEMHEVKGLGMVIDTPGIKGLGVIDIPRDEISHYFPEMLKFVNKCRFNNCTHLDEPDCAVKSAVSTEDISESRYHSYLSIMEEENSRYRASQ